MSRLLAWCVAFLGIGASLASARAQSARVELDHVFIVVPPGGAAEIAALRSAGLTVRSEPSEHDGQGTASVAAFFDNAYLELIWVDSSVSIDQEHAHTAERFRQASAWRETGMSPFGFGLRRLAGDTAALPVPVKREFAAWLPPGAAYELLHQAADSLAADFFVVPPSNAVPSWIAAALQRWPDLFRHSGGGREVTLVRVASPAVHEPTAFRVLQPGRIEIIRGTEPLLELHIDGGMRGQRTDLRPSLPLVIVR